MAKTRIWAIVLTIAMVVTAIAGCSSASAPATETPSTAPQTSTAASATTASSNQEMYEFTYYYGYDWATIANWGNDDTSKWLQDKFNVKIDMQKPEGDPAAKMSIMVASGELPDVIQMDKDNNYIKLATMGKLVALDDYLSTAKYYKPLPQSVNLDKINGKTYCVMNCYLNGPTPTGGNLGWAISSKVYDLAGKSEINTMEDLYNYAKKVKSLNLNINGGPVIPIMFDSQVSYQPPYIDFGCANNSAYGLAVQSDGTLKSMINNPAWVETIVWMNRLVREGLTNKDVLTMTIEQQQEYLSTGRFGAFYGNLMYNLFSDNNLRKTVSDLGDGNGIEYLDWPVAQGVEQATLKSEPRYSTGWNAISITTSAKKPERIFEILDWGSSVEGTRVVLYGVQGSLDGFIYSNVDDKGYPVVNKAVSFLSDAQIKTSGIGLWQNYGASQLWDYMKYAVNDQLPNDKQDYATYVQENFLSKHLFYDDASYGFSTLFSPDSDLSVLSTNCTDLMNKGVNNAIMAASEADCQAVLAKLKTDLYNMGYAQIEQAFTQQYQKNLTAMGK